MSEMELEDFKDYPAEQSTAATGRYKQQRRNSMPILPVKSERNFRHGSNGDVRKTKSSKNTFVDGQVEHKTQDATSDPFVDILGSIDTWWDQALPTNSELGDKADLLAESSRNFPHPTEQASESINTTHSRVLKSHVPFPYPVRVMTIAGSSPQRSGDCRPSRQTRRSSLGSNQVASTSTDAVFVLRHTGTQISSPHGMPFQDRYSGHERMRIFRDRPYHSYGDDDADTSFSILSSNGNRKRQETTDETMNVSGKCRVSSLRAEKTTFIHERSIGPGMKSNVRNRRSASVDSRRLVSRTKALSLQPHQSVQSGGEVLRETLGYGEAKPDSRQHKRRGSLGSTGSLSTNGCYVESKARLDKHQSSSDVIHDGRRSRPSRRRSMDSSVVSTPSQVDSRSPRASVSRKSYHLSTTVNLDYATPMNLVHCEQKLVGYDKDTSLDEFEQGSTRSRRRGSLRSGGFQGGRGSFGSKLPEGRPPSPPSISESVTPHRQRRKSMGHRIGSPKSVAHKARSSRVHAQNEEHQAAHRSSHQWDADENMPATSEKEDWFNMLAEKVSKSKLTSESMVSISNDGDDEGGPLRRRRQRRSSIL